MLIHGGPTTAAVGAGVEAAIGTFKAAASAPTRNRVIVVVVEGCLRRGHPASRHVCLTYEPDVPLEGTQRRAGFAGAKAQGQLFPSPIPSRRWTARRDAVGDPAGDRRGIDVERCLADLDIDRAAVGVDEQRSR